MLFKVYSVFDTCANAYLQPMFFVTRGQAIRALTEAVNSSDHNFHKYADQYCLFEIGSFDDSDCRFDLYDCPVSIGLCSEFKAFAVSSGNQLVFL